MTAARAGSWLLAAATAIASFPAVAQETEVASEDVQTPPAAQEQDTGPDWTIAGSTGISSRDDGPDGTWQALSLTRRLGRGYLRGALMRYHGTLQQSDAALPSDYFVATLAGGGNFNGWVTDGWVSLGYQDYGRISTSDGVRASTGATGSAYYATGADFGKVLGLGGNWYLTPTLAASYANGKLLRPAPTGSDFNDLETDEPAWSANATLRLDHAFGASKAHYAGLSVSRNWTSNAVSAVRTVTFDDTEGPTALDSKHYADGWFEVGATANMRLTPSLHVDIFATRGFGMLAGNTTSAGISLRKSF